MKIATIVAFACPLATYATPHVHRSTPFLSRKPSSTHNPAQHNSASASSCALPNMIIPRGGDLGPITSEALAKTMGVLAIGDALAGTIDPVETWSKFGIAIEPGSKGEHYMGHGMASSAASLAATSLLALTSATSAEEAVGYGFLVRCAYMTESLSTNKYKELGVPNVPHVVIYLVLLAAAAGLIGGNSDYGDLAKVVSIMLAGHGGLLFVNQRIDGDEETKKMAEFEGGYMFLSSGFAALLAFGVDPVKAMGCASILSLALVGSMLDLVEGDELFGISTGTWQMGAVMVMSVAAYGMLS